MIPIWAVLLGVEIVLISAEEKTEIAEAGYNKDVLTGNVRSHIPGIVGKRTYKQRTLQELTMNVHA